MGRPKGSKNKSNHNAGSQHSNSGRKNKLTQSNSLFDFIPRVRRSEESENDESKESETKSRKQY